MAIYLFLLVFVVLIIVVMLVLMVILKKLRNKIKAKLIGIKNKTFFNGIIQSLNVAYIDFCISCKNQFGMQLAGS